MAGIGFRLQKLLSGDSYTDIVKAYLYSAMIAAGPMLVVMATLGIVKQVAQASLGLEGEAQFMSLVVYVYSASMVTVSPFYFTVTRYLADRYYSKEYSTFTPTYFSVLGLVIVIQVATCGLWVYFLPVSFQVAVWEVLLYVSVSGIWIATIFLSAARSYVWMALSFVIGCVGGTVLGIWGGYHFGMAGFLGGFTLGQVVVWLLLSLQIVREFGYHVAYQFGFLHYFIKYPILAIVGLFYYVGIWIDKWVFWLSSYSLHVFPALWVMPDYDTPLFVAYLTVVPSLAFFLIQMETEFVRVYQSYFVAIRRHATFGVIGACEKRIAETISAQFQRFAVFQGIISGMTILFAPQIATLFKLSPLQVGIFRVGILGAFMQMGMIMIINILFYLDAQIEVMLLTLAFLLCNAGFAQASLYFGLPAFGFGYTVASFVSLLMGFFVLDNRLRNMSYWTFMRQPVIIPKFKLESE